MTRGRKLAVPASRAFAGDEDAYLDEIVSGLDEADQDIIRMLERVKAVYVESGRDRLMADEFKKFFREINAKRNGRRDDGRIFFVTGESGAGKTYAVEHLLAKYPGLQPRATGFGVQRPVISVTLSGPCTLRVLGRQILRAAGYSTEKAVAEGLLWDMLPEQLRHRGVILVHIDETQHMLRQTEGDHERKNVAKAIKGVMNYKPWPVSFIMSGMPETTELASRDDQIERRDFPVYLPPLDMPDDRGIVIDIIRRMSAAAPIDASRAIVGDLPERVAHSAAYQIGRVSQIVLSALDAAFERKAEKLTHEHFVHAYLSRSHARGHDDLNPFLVDDWNTVPAGLFHFEAERTG